MKSDHDVKEAAGWVDGGTRVLQRKTVGAIRPSASMPSSVGDFVSQKQLGAGASGVVRLVRRRADNRLYALKELDLPSDHGEAAAMLQESHILAAIEHPFVIRYYDSFVEHRKLYLIME